eukprot:CCRYP_014730-RA/>CCRYP_014730-RA protein AED:0.00 eAED:0.00 QI:296/1/1/1/0/0/2/114/394
MSQTQTSLDDALSLDIHVLSILLQRNRHQHHRCIYFRRLSMVLQALRKNRPSIEALDGWKRDVETLSKSLHETTSNGKAASGKKRPQKEEQWTIEQLAKSSSAVADTNSGHTQELDEASHLQTLVDNVQSLVTESIREISSRILHAASAIFQELSRGHFLPFLTVAIACLGRIHSIVLQMGRESVNSLKENKIKWDGNMDYLFEVSHDELLKKINACVDDLRWKDGVCRFKMRKGLANTVDVSQAQTNTSGDRCNSISNNQNVLEDETSPLDDDPGEIVAAASNFTDGLFVQDDSLAVDSLEQDPNASEMVKSDHKNDDVHSTSEKQMRKKKKKKKRKDKKKEACDIDAIFFDNDSDDNKKDDNSKEAAHLTKQKVTHTKNKRKRGSIIDDIFS